jgi:hypothetical protein
MGREQSAVEGRCGGDVGDLGGGGGPLSVWRGTRGAGGLQGLGRVEVLWGQGGLGGVSVERGVACREPLLRELTTEAAERAQHFQPRQSLAAPSTNHTKVMHKSHTALHCSGPALSLTHSLAAK